MAQLIGGFSAERVRENLEQVQERVSRAAQRAARRASEVEILAATKYVAGQDLPKLAQAGVRLVGENRAQDLVEKYASHEDLFVWDFIGQLQSRKVAVIL